MSTPDFNGRWPAPYTSAAVLTIDYNDIHGILTQVPTMAGRDKSLSVWRYGTTRGVQRLLDVFAEQGVRTTWCIPGIVAQENPEVIRSIHAAGHEIACAGYRHENFSTLDLAAQQASLLRGCAVLEQLTGERPRGFRAPAGSYAPGFADVLRSAGLRWSSSWAGDDLPYLHPGPGNALVELPLHCELEDAPYFAFNLAPAVPASQARIASYAEVLDNWQRDLAGFQRFGLCAVMRLHPEILGTVGRIALLDECLGWLKGQPGVWISSAEEVATWWAQATSADRPGAESDHPAAVFARHQPGALHEQP
ncbi:polysaccharide deacetylase family protein [Pseudomonas sp. UBA4194]|uniref:polysaccharide deacetylase family protein n=1 Tax=Pseudomonas sp. UBA4194 TaxID=1947317 RepID=UPI0025DBE91D|nr:polysaccharide deacetylase [Pseudomonas sp. UBA4194]